MLLSTHYMEEADHLCDRVAIMDQGRLLACAAPAELKRGSRATSMVTIALRRPPNGLAGRLRAIPGVRRVASHVGSVPLLAAVAVLASLTSGALGLVIGTLVRPDKMGLVFAALVVPLTFLGCVYSPWSQLHVLPALQLGVLANPLVYMERGPAGGADGSGAAHVCARVTRRRYGIRLPAVDLRAVAVRPPGPRLSGRLQSPVRREDHARTRV